MNVENFVTSKIGKDTGGMMNLAKSRNDQVATALRMTLREQLIFLGESMISLENSLLDQAGKTRRNNNSRLHPPAKSTTGDSWPPPARIL